jgi:chemotaxis protein CheD
MAGVRMGEMIVSANPTDELIALGLGSCIGLAIVDRTAGVAGLAHIVLPESHPGAAPGKFADTAVPQLVERMRAAGAVVRRMEAAMVGGARMFDMSGTLDIGARNDQAVRAELAQAQVALRATATGGNQGRTVRIEVGAGIVSVRGAGQRAVTLLDASSAATAGPTRAAGSRAAGAHRPRPARTACAAAATGAQP